MNYASRELGRPQPAGLPRWLPARPAGGAAPRAGRPLAHNRTVRGAVHLFLSRHGQSRSSFSHSVIQSVSLSARVEVEREIERSAGGVARNVAGRGSRWRRTRCCRATCRPLRRLSSDRIMGLSDTFLLSTGTFVQTDSVTTLGNHMMKPRQSWQSVDRCHATRMTVQWML